MIETVEDFLGNGLKINHLIEVDFKDFPKLIDALGGVTVEQQDRDLRAALRQLLEGLQPAEGRAAARRDQALGYSRVRKNPCAPAENDLDRAARQQEVLSGDRGTSSLSHAPSSACRS